MPSEAKGLTRREMSQAHATPDIAENVPDREEAPEQSRMECGFEFAQYTASVRFRVLLLAVIQSMRIQ